MMLKVTFFSSQLIRYPNGAHSRSVWPSKKKEKKRMVHNGVFGRPRCRCKSSRAVYMQLQTNLTSLPGSTSHYS
ncbi:hypothetical protein AYI70_g6651 [Smittium culicis]|uniref:Uncharacterized protein n=1 Tax=Smittium culicis TaxID=133412 RepID=A0A1R1XP16_9FUNG|nr:hypothetical protein AYI70_g6651 [Smittium culicis]